MNEIKVYAQDCMPDLIKQIYKWSTENRESVEVSITDLLLMANHIEDLELEVYGDFSTSSTYTITRNECSNAYAKVTYRVEASSKEKAIDKLKNNEAKLESFIFNEWSEDGSNWIEEESKWEIVND